MTATQKHVFDAPIDAIECRQDGLLVVCTSNVFGNTWDGGIHVMAQGQFGQVGVTTKIPTPSGCTDLTFIDASGKLIAVSCDDGNVAIYNVDSLAMDGVPTKLLTFHENCATSVCANVLSPGTIFSASMDHTIILSDLNNGGSGFVAELKGAVISFLTFSIRSTARIKSLLRACAIDTL